MKKLNLGKVVKQAVVVEGVELIVNTLQSIEAPQVENIKLVADAHLI